MRKGFFLLLLSIIWEDCFTQHKPSFWRKLHPDSIASKDVNLIPIPTIEVTPETGLEVGISLDYFLNTDKKDTTHQMRDSYMWVQGQITTRKQQIIEGYWSVYTPKEKWYIGGKAAILDYYEKYWGTSAPTFAEKSFYNITYDRFYINSRALRQVWGKQYVGLNYDFSDYWDVAYERDKHFHKVEEYGATGSRVSGLGPIIMCDYRNNLFSPSEGWFLEAGSRFYRPFLGSRFIYDTYWIDVRKYFHVGKKSLFAAQGFTQISTGEVPIMEKNRLGGSNMMRGFFLGRYRDNVYGMVQSEFRHPLHRLITGAIFVAAGQTAPSLSQASLQRTLIAGGAGVRLLVNKKKSVFLRIDLAVNQYGGLGYYLRVGDAF